jgi:hypothetical protein
MEMVKSLIEMVTKLSCEVQEIKSDNTTLKLQLQDLHQFRIPAPSISTKALLSTHDAAAKTYRDVLTSGGGHPASTAVPSGPNRQTSLPASSVMARDTQAADGFITVLGKRNVNLLLSLQGCPTLRRELGLDFLVLKAAHLFQLYPRESEPRSFLSPDSLLMYHQLTYSSL